MIKKVVGILILLVLFGCKKSDEPNLLRKVDKTQTNITFQNVLKPTDSPNILDYLYYYNGGGVAVGDINNDGLVDIYFTSNLNKNKLYLNKGNFVFEDITEKAGVAGNSDWNTGTVMADINGDGYLDIYVCAVVGIHGFKGSNELFINNGDNTFTEQAEKYGLNFQNYSTTVAFFDYDNDDDLDMYLLNHAVHSQNSFGRVSVRYERDEKSGDKLLRNDGETFTNVSEEAGIFGGANGYGLGLATQDFNNDGYVDIYVSNDFHEDDYYYLNNGDGTFTEQLKMYFGKTSRFSMGSDVTDINHDGYSDILTLDMTPDDEAVLKSSMVDETVDNLNFRTQKLGYHYQYARNMLQINNGDYFSETAILSGLSATDWSWSALFCDFNQDGEQDVFISNGIPKRPNNLDYIKYISNDEIKKSLNTTRLVDDEALNIMPSGAVANYIFEGKGNLAFQDQSGKWMTNDTIMSTGIAYADLDNDGDLDIVTNNINSEAGIFRNTIDEDTSANYLKLKFNYKKGNLFGIGTKVISYHNGKQQFKQLFTSKGFQSSSEPIIHFGYGSTKTIDSLKVIWPDNTIQTAENIKTNQTLTITLLNKRFSVNYESLFPEAKPWFIKTNSISGLQFSHKENNYSDVNRHKLIPYQISDRGPATAVGDLNGDGKDDVFFGSSRDKLSQLFIQTKDGFVKKQLPMFEDDKIYEDTAACINDFNGDGKNDLFMASGGGEFGQNAKPLLDRLYLNEGDLNFVNASIPDYFEHASVIKAFDADGDGDLDIFVGNHVNPFDFSELPNSYILLNDHGTFNLKKIEGLGMVTDAIITDFNNDNQPDIVAVGEWMSPTFLQNTNGTFKDMTTNVLKDNLKGLWQCIAKFDIDNDGDEDYILGNYGLNTKFKASKKYPMKMYVTDFDDNKTSETIVAIEKNGKYYTTMGLDELSGQLTYLKKKYNTYKKFAGQTVEEIFGKETLDRSTLYTVSTLASGYLQNNKGQYTFIPFKKSELQLAPITAALEFDFNGDGKNEMLLAGNYFGVTPYQGKFDSFSGAILEKDGNVLLNHQTGINLFGKAIRNLNIINFKDKNYLLVTINNDEIEIYEFKQ